MTNHIMNLEPFDSARPRLEKQYENVKYAGATGLNRDKLKAILDQHLEENPDEPRVLTRAFLLNLVFTQARFVIEKDNPFAGKIDRSDLITSLRAKWWQAELAKRLDPQEQAEAQKLGAGFMVDVSHVAPDWEAVLKLGFTGLRDRALKAGNTPFHQAVALVFDGAIQFCRRCGQACKNDAMLAIAERPPQTLLEAFVLAYLYHDLAELNGEEVRSMGWFDKLYIDFYKHDIDNGILTRDQAKELIKYFWIAFYAKYQGLRFGKNFCFGPDVNELSYLSMEVYHEMNIVDPKLSVRVADNTPQDFLEAIARNIRDGRTGIVMLNNQVVVDGLIKHGRSPEDAKDFIPIGCYEPAVLGKEVSLSGATHLYLPKVFEAVLYNDRQYETFQDFFEDYLNTCKHAIDLMCINQVKCEQAWPFISPAAFLSGTFQNCLDTGKDYSEGGCLYNSTGCVVSYAPETADALAAVNYLVFDKKICTLDELRQACKNDWKGYEKLQAIARSKAPKYGNNDDAVDEIAVKIAQCVGPYINSKPNARGGHFFASIYGQAVVNNGKKIGALPNGRNAGTPVSKNMDACIGMDKHGITALMNTVLKIDMTNFPCGTCLDLMLHPTAVQGDEGVKTIANIIRSFIQRGGSGLQFNIFDADTLKDAQANPDKHPNLQVRVCGWNARFVDLKTEEQNTFIDQASSL